MTTAIVIPTHDRAAMVVEAVESALGQSEPARVIVVDDGSTDDTRERLARFGEAITLLRQPNRERGAARNRGAAEAGDAELLLFLDADDVLLPDHVARLRTLVRDAPEAPLVAAPVLVTGPDLRPRGIHPHMEPGRVRLRPFLLTREAVPPSATAVRAEAFRAVGGFDERRELAGSEDWLLVARLLVLGDGVRGEEPTVLFRRHPRNTMADAERMRRSMLLAHRLFFEDAPGELDLLRGPSRARLLLRSAVGFYAAGRMGESRRELLRAVRADPGVLAEPLLGWTFARSLLGARLTGWLRRWKQGRR